MEEFEILDWIGSYKIDNARPEKTIEAKAFCLDEFQVKAMQNRSNLSEKEFAKLVQDYQAQVGVGYYNLDITSKDEAEKFFINYGVGPLFSRLDYEDKLELLQNQRKLTGGTYWSSDDPDDSIGRTGFEAGFPFEVDALRSLAEHRKYRRFIDQVIKGDPFLKEYEIEIIDDMVSENHVQIRRRGGGRWQIVPSSVLMEGHQVILKSAYRWGLLVSRGDIEVDRCAAEDCNNIFIPYKPGKEQHFCSHRCYQRIYTRKRRRQEKQQVLI